MQGYTKYCPKQLKIMFSIIKIHIKIEKKGVKNTENYKVYVPGARPLINLAGARENNDSNLCIT